MWTREDCSALQLWLIQAHNYHHPKTPPTVAMVTASRNKGLWFHSQAFPLVKNWGGNPGSIHQVSNTSVYTCRQTGGRTLPLNHRYFPCLKQWVESVTPTYGHWTGALSKPSLSFCLDEYWCHLCGECSCRRVKTGWWEGLGMHFKAVGSIGSLCGKHRRQTDHIMCVL